MTGSARRSRRWVKVCFVSYAATLVWLLIGPEPGAQVRAATEAANSLPLIGDSVADPPRLTQVREGTQLNASHARTSRVKRSPGHVLGHDPERVANVAIFVPLGCAVGLMAPRSIRANSSALLTGGAVEVIQLALTGWRTPSLGDAVSNGVGVTLGLLAVAAWRLVQRVRPPLRSSGTTHTL